MQPILDQCYFGFSFYSYVVSGRMYAKVNQKPLWTSLKIDSFVKRTHMTRVKNSLVKGGAAVKNLPNFKEMFTTKLRMFKYEYLEPSILAKYFPTFP